MNTRRAFLMLDGTMFAIDVLSWLDRYRVPDWAVVSLGEFKSGEVTLTATWDQR